MFRSMSFGLVVLLAAVDASAQGRPQQNQARQAQRFAEMDTNRDGVITRQEWRGSARSFEVHDWNNDDVLSGDELRPGGRRAAREAEPPPFESAQREYEFTDWTARGFRSLDHDQNGRVTRDEWHFDVESFRRADHNNDGILTRQEFLGTDSRVDDDRDDRFANLDTNNDNRVSRAEWHGTPERFDAIDSNRDGVLTRVEARGGTEPPPDLFTSVDANRDGQISRDEWHWARASFDSRDRNNDGRLSRDEFTGNAQAQAKQSEAWRRGHDTGLTEGRKAGKEDRAATWGWDLEGQRELETADSGYEPRFGSRAEYQAGYREGFRRGYREGFGK